MESFRWAVMGAGKIAVKFCEAVKLISHCTVSAIASKSKKRAEAFAAENDIPVFYDDYEEMLKKEKPDGVYIAVTPHDHFRLSMLCAKYKVPVLCEKAMFMCKKEAEEFFDYAEKQQIFSMEAMWSRFLPALKKGRELIRSGKIGNVVTADFDIGCRVSDDPENRYLNPKLGGGAAFDITVYGYEIMTWMLESHVKRVHAEAVRGKTGVDLTEILLLLFENGVPATIRSTFACDLEEDNGITVYGTKGRVHIPHPHFGREVFFFENGKSEPEIFTDTKTKNGFVYETEEAVRCIREGKTESSVVPHKDTLACAEIFDLILKSME